MRKRFLLKLSLRTLDQLKAFIFVCPCSDEQFIYFSTSSFAKPYSIFIIKPHSKPQIFHNHIHTTVLTTPSAPTILTHTKCWPSNFCDWPERPGHRCEPRPGSASSPHDLWQGGGESHTSPTCEPLLVTESLILLVFDLWQHKPQQ